ncbi:exported hypothetical protein [Candidatus Terasakiella magnetica]|uniref:Lipoprotein n=1 Tax=Candidatus Terasakiella magnetica TaxID=1867952 RepID=A0A1C3RKZ3_9PROT|nr:hypothetical protein [Candidatus Terasakiella magnetica]SCA57944.1 exported hypothetical protein [Candidatus Terasakiella magnetica]
MRAMKAEKVMQACVIVGLMVSLAACSTVSAIGGATLDVATFVIGDVAVPLTTTVVEGAVDVVGDNPDTAVKALGGLIP